MSRRAYFYGIWTQGVAPREGGGGYARDGRYLYGSIVPVRRQRPMDVGTGTPLLLRRLSPLGLVPLFTRVWRAEEREVGRNGVQELISETLEIGGGGFIRYRN